MAAWTQGGTLLAEGRSCCDRRKRRQARGFLGGRNSRVLVTERQDRDVFSGATGHTMARGSSKCGVLRDPRSMAWVGAALSPRLAGRTPLSCACVAGEALFVSWFWETVSLPGGRQGRGAPASPGGSLTATAGTLLRPLRGPVGCLTSGRRGLRPPRPPSSSGLGTPVRRLQDGPRDTCPGQPHARRPPRERLRKAPHVSEPEEPSVSSRGPLRRRHPPPPAPVALPLTCGFPARRPSIGALPAVWETVPRPPEPSGPGFPGSQHTRGRGAGARDPAPGGPHAPLPRARNPWPRGCESTFPGRLPSGPRSACTAEGRRGPRGRAACLAPGVGGSGRLPGSALPTCTGLRGPP